VTPTPFATGTEGIFYGLPAEDYHKAPGVSHSMLKHMNPPARLPVYLSKKREPSPAMMIGTHVHGVVLTPEEPLPGITVAPEGMKFNTKEGMAWKAAQDPRLMVVKHDEFLSIDGCVQAVAEHPTCRKIFEPGGAPEVSLFAHDWRPSFKFLRKCRIDYVPAGNSLVDIKTVRDEGAGEDEFSKTLFDLRYYTQASYYLDMWNRLNPDDQRTQFVFIVVEKAPPYLVNIFYVNPDDLELGKTRNEADLSKFAQCSLDKSWPGYEPEPKAIGIPHWAKTKEGKRQYAEWAEKVEASA
jgi:hypothetical protein